MKRPTLKKRKDILDYHEMIRYINKKYDINVRDYANKFRTPSGNLVVLTSEEQDAIPYLDYWHWLLENHFNDVRNPCEQYFHVGDIIERYKEGENIPLWVIEITQLIHAEFADLLDDEDGIEVHIEW